MSRANVSFLPVVGLPESQGLLSFTQKVYLAENLDVESPATEVDYLVQVRTLQKFFNGLCLAEGQLARDVTLADLSSSLVTQCMKWLHERGRSARTCNKFRRTILAIHNFAIDERELPLKRLKVKKYHEPKIDRRAWRPAEIPRILAAARAMRPVKRGEWDGRHDFALLLFLLNTGTRISAAMLTPRECLDLTCEPPLVTVPAAVQKHDADETFDLLPITVAALKAIGAASSQHDTIFGAWAYDDRRRGKWRTLTRRLKKILVAGGLFPSVAAIPKRRELFHKLRRCFATFVRMKFGKAAAKELCGHSHESVTEVYFDETQTADRPSCIAALADKIIAPEIAAQSVDRQLLLRFE
jgi:integrase